jgi:hypothetical protein
MGGDSSNNIGEWCAVYQINAVSVVCVYVRACVIVIIIIECVVVNTLTNICNYHTHAQISCHQFNFLSNIILLITAFSLFKICDKDCRMGPLKSLRHLLKLP